MQLHKIRTLRGDDARTVIKQHADRVRSDHWTQSSHEIPVAIVVPAQENDVLELRPAHDEHLLIVVRQNAQVTIVEQGSGHFTVDILAEDNAHIKYHSMSDSSIAVRRFAKLEQDASIAWTDYAHGDEVHSVVTTVLAGEGADAQFRSVFLGTKKERYTIKTSMIHTASKSTSNMLTRAVMMGESSGEYEGLIKIAPEAAGCDAYQKAETLLLGTHAKMHATPNLEISNEDVRCSHGVSLGQIEGEKLFYFLSRGIGREEALRLMTEGFFATILEHMGEYAGPAMTNVRTRLGGTNA